MRRYFFILNQSLNTKKATDANYDNQLLKDNTFLSLKGGHIHI